MTADMQAMNALELASLRDDGKRYELLEGRLHVMSPAGGQHGRIAMRIGSMLEQHVRANRVGQVFAAETGFLLSRNPDTVRAPDVAFVHRHRYERLTETEGYLPLAPDLVIEVVSPSDAFSEIEKKVQAWLGYGCRTVLVVDPAMQCIRVHRDREAIDVYGVDDDLELNDAVPGWRLSVAEVFEP